MRQALDGSLRGRSPRRCACSRRHAGASSCPASAKAARRPEDRGDVRLDRHAGVLRASERGVARRPRHDHGREDVILALSWSGETVELGNIITYSRRFAVPLISITSQARIRRSASSRTWCSSCRGRRKPARTGSRRPRRRRCSSRSATASRLRCSKSRGFTAHDFKIFHPGGSLGASLKYVADVMHKA